MKKYSFSDKQKPKHKIVNALHKQSVFHFHLYYDHISGWEIEEILDGTDRHIYVNHKFLGFTIESAIERINNGVANGFLIVKQSPTEE